MADATVVYGISVEGSAEAQAALNRTTAATQAFADKANHTADAIKLVGKDLDNLGLKAGKTFAMTVEGALSVVAALGTGGVAGVVGAVTVGVGYLAQAWADQEAEAQRSKKATEEAIAAEEKRWTAASRMASEFLALSKGISVEQKRQALVEQAAYLVELERAIEEEQEKVISGEVETGARLMELRALYAAEEADGRRMAAEFKTMEQEAADKAEIEELEKQEKAKEEARKKAADKAAKEREAELAHLQKLHDADVDMYLKREEDLDKKRAEIATAAAKRAAFEQESQDKYYKDKYDAEIKAQEDAKKANDEAAKSEERRREELAKTAKALQEKHEQEVRNQIATQASAAANIAFGVSATITGPIIAEYTGMLRQLGDVNRDNYRDFVLFSDELPAIIAKKTQAIMGGIAAEATGKALQSSADAAREMALGLGLVAIPGMGAQAAGHFTSAGTHMMAASMYGALGTGAAVGAVGLGALRGSGGPIALTREEQQRNATRDGGGAGGGGGISGGRMSGSGAGGDGGAFVVNIAYQAGSIAPADENRAARTVASATRRARSNAFDRRRMGA